TSTVRKSLDSTGSLTPAGIDQLRNISQVLKARITLIVSDGTVTFDTNADPRQMQNHNDRPEVLDARREHIGSSSRLSATLGEHAVYLAELLDDSKPDGLVVRVSFPKRHWAKLEMPIWLASGGGLLAAVLMVGLLALILQRQWVAPTRDLAGAAEMMAAGQWHARVDPHGADDVRFLAGRMNLVASHAQNQLEEIGKQRRDLRSLVDTLPDPILVTDSTGKVLLINAPAAELLQLAPAQVIGKKTVSVVNDEALLQLLESASKSTRPIQREVRLLRSGQRLTYQSV